MNLVDKRITELESRVAELEKQICLILETIGEKEVRTFANDNVCHCPDHKEPHVHHVKEDYKCSCCGNVWKGIGDIDDGVCDKCNVLNLPVKPSKTVAEDRCVHGVHGTDCFKCYPSKPSKTVAEKPQGVAITWECRKCTYVWDSAMSTPTCPNCQSGNVSQKAEKPSECGHEWFYHPEIQMSSCRKCGIQAQGVPFRVSSDKILIDRKVAEEWIATTGETMKRIHQKLTDELTRALSSK